MHMLETHDNRFTVRKHVFLFRIIQRCSALHLGMLQQNNVTRGGSQRQCSLECRVVTGGLVTEQHNSPSMLHLIPQRPFILML